MITSTAPQMRADVLVYISGPITAYDGYSLEDNIDEGVAVFLTLVARGIPAVCPHLSGTIEGITWERWLAHDLMVLARCTHVVMLPRWEASRGARIEKAWAEAKGIPVLVMSPGSIEITDDFTP